VFRLPAVWRVVDGVWVEGYLLRCQD